MADFGITSVYDHVDEGLYKLPSAKGTVLYMSPMMIQSIDCTLNDFWSLSCILLNMVTVYILNNNPQPVNREYFNLISPNHFFEAIMKICKIPHELNEDKTFTSERIVKSLINDTSSEGCNNFIECVKKGTNKFKNKQIKMELLKENTPDDIRKIFDYILDTVKLFDSNIITKSISNFLLKSKIQGGGQLLQPLLQSRPQSGFRTSYGLQRPSTGLRLQPRLLQKLQPQPIVQNPILNQYITTLNAINNITATDENSIKEELRKYIKIDELEKLYNEQNKNGLINGGKKIIKRKTKNN